MHKQSAGLFLSMVLGAGLAGCHKQAASDRPAGVSRDSYTLGYQMGRALKQQGVTVDAKVYAEALRDGLAGKSPEVSEADMTVAVKGLRQRVAQKQQAKPGRPTGPITEARR